MRILYSHRIQSHDGQGVHIEALIAALRAAGHEVCVVGPPAYDAVALGGESPTLARIRRLLPGVLRELAEMAYGLVSTVRLARAARTFRPDIVYERANLFHVAGSWTAWRHGVPLMLEVNSPLAEERTRFSGLRLKRLAHAAERFVWRRADFVLPVTEVLAGHVTAAGVPRTRIAVVPNGIDLEDFAGLPTRPASEAVQLGFVGFVRHWHGLDRVLRGLAAWKERRASTSPWWGMGRRALISNPSRRNSASPTACASPVWQRGRRSLIWWPASTSRCSLPLSPMPRR